LPYKGICDGEMRFTSYVPPSFDHRYKDAAGDIYQHTRDRGRVLYDGRFNLLHTSDTEFLRFPSETVHPVVRPGSEAVDTLVGIYNEALAADVFARRGARRGSLRGELASSNSAYPALM
jgi:hypothetical protein